jgi:transcriptional regulator with XRE-family HTH domain
VQIAKACGVSAQTLSNYLTGKRAIPNELLAVLAKRFNISTDDLLAEADKSPLDEPSRQQIPIIGRATAGPLASDTGAGGQTIRLEVGSVAITITVEPAAQTPP